MSRTLGELTIDVRNILDDLNDDPTTQSEWSPDEVTLALQRAQATTLNVMMVSGRADINSQITVQQGANGIAILPPNKKVLAVWISNSAGQSLIKVQRSSGFNRSYLAQGVNSLLVDYIAVNVFPVSDSDVMTYAQKDVDDPIVDAFCAYAAARDLKTKELEGNPLLDQQLSNYEALLTQQDTPVVEAAPLWGATQSQGWTNWGRMFWYPSSSTSITLFR